MKRTFIACKISPGDKLLKTYTKLRNELKNEKIKWVNSDHFHITLFFLGDTDEEMIPRVRTQVGNLVDQFSSFQIKLSGLGVFKNMNKPRVLWAGIYQYETMKEIKEGIENEMVALGFPAEKKEFRPHLTMARLKWINDKEKLKGLINDYQDEDFQQVKINEIIYYESILKPSGPVYKPIEKFILPD
ncbi:MAG: RNA 2',3'-cyclic phosphodiesterase [Bacteroidales bacterium]|nr:RNA 2',3'-cyclic phosphodiesterase [Bacteroidales bacterium]MBS3774162.1 RNA 2',3'-cyclic phosphodiesterase [Bacteroidales bacterium]